MKYAKLLVTLGIVAALAGFAGVVAAGTGIATGTSATSQAASNAGAGLPLPHPWSHAGSCTQSQGNTTQTTSTGS